MALPAAMPAVGEQRIAYVCPPGMQLRHAREGFFGELLAAGHRLLVLAPGLSGTDAHALSRIGAEHGRFAADPGGPRLLADWRIVAGLKQRITEWTPHVLVATGGRSMLHGALAARAAGVGHVVLVVDSLPERRFAGAPAADEMPAWRYRQAFRAADATVFYNRDDLALCRRLGLLSEAASATVVPGAGVDAAQPVIPLPRIGQGLVFLMIADLDRRRGVIEYCEAAAKLRRQSPGARFLLAGPPGEGQGAVDPVTLGSYADVEYLGDAADEAALIAQCHVFAYPAATDGMPQPVLRALTAGRPVVTTAVPGCRDMIDERVNGCLVPARDTAALAEAMESFLRRPDLIPAMARASRAKAERFGSADAARRSLFEVLQVNF